MAEPPYPQALTVPYGVPMAADADIGQARRPEVTHITLVLPWGRSGGPAVVAAVLGIGQVIWYTIELLRGYFQQDDFALLYLGGSQPLSEILLRDYAGHLQPGAFVVCKLIARLAPLNWPVAVGVLVVLHAAAVLILWRLLVRLFGLRWAILVPFVLIAFSPPTFVMTTWWAYGLQMLPVQLALIGALYAHVCHLQEPSWKRIAQAVLWTAFGLAFWEKAVLIPAVLFGVTAALATGGLWARLVTVFSRFRWLWLGYVVLLTGYAIVHVLNTPSTFAKAITFHNVRTLIGYMIGDSLAPALFGGPWSGEWVGFRALASPDTWVLVVSWTAAIVMVLIGLWLGRVRATAAWVTLLGYIVVSILLITLTRLGPVLGPITGADRRYIADVQVIAVFLATLALLRPRIAVASTRTAAAASDTDAAAVEHGRRRARPTWAAAFSMDRLPLWVPVAGLAAVVFGTVLSITGGLAEHRNDSGRAYVDNVKAVMAAEPDLVLYDTTVNTSFMSPLFGDFTFVSKALLGLGLRFDESSPDLRMLDADGNPRKIGLVATVGSPVGPVEGCGYLLGEKVARIPLADTAEGTRMVARIGYYGREARDGAISTPHARIPVRFEAGLHEVSIVVDGPFDEVLVEADGPVCVGGVLVGLPLPHMN